MENQKGRKILVEPVTNTVVDDDLDGVVFSHKERRFVIVDAETHEVLDDAQGYGYKTRQKAFAAWSYKSKTPKQRKAYKAKQKKIQKWLSDYPDFELDYEDMLFQALKIGSKVEKSDLEALLNSERYSNATKDLPFTINDLWRWLQKH